MAGFYPDVPGPRMACDRDGSILLCDGVQVSAGVLSNVTDEDSANSGAGNVVTNFTMVFPEARDMAGIFISYAGNAGEQASVATSGDTTNGIDGTWTTRITSALPENPGVSVASACRTITSLTTTSVKGVRVTPAFQNGRQLVAFHLYGSPSTGANPNRLALWDPVSDVALGGAALDFGDAPRGSIASKSVRIKNLSATLTAHAPALSFQYLIDATPTLAGQFQFSTDGGTTWVTTASLADLAPATISAVIQIRRNTSASAQVSAWQGRFVAVPTSMS